MPAPHPLDFATVFREYEPHELKNGRYPYVWDALPLPEHDALFDAADMVLPGGVKDVVRQVAGHRCQRCGHPCWVGKGLGEWSDDPPPTDEVIYPALFDGLTTNERRQITAGRTHWSPCDDRCRHSYIDSKGRVTGRWRTTDGWQALDDEAVARRLIYDHHASVQAAYRILTVHHLNERKHDLRWWNLAALCQRCHLVIQRKVTMEVSWPWDHSDWFKPHAAAWYALKYLGEHLTYTQTRARLDELLELGKAEEATERMAL